MLNYFNFKGKSKTWLEITREERFFCAELYQDIKKNISGFVKFLNANCNVDLDEHSYWEVGYEVCFYRDFIKATDDSIKKHNKQNQLNNPNYEDYPPKRTFDLCLFSNEKIVIIEAKADQKFNKLQLEYLRNDKEIFIPKILTGYISKSQVDSIFLCSSGNKQEFEDFKGKKIYWNQLHDFYRNENYKRADELGKPKKLKT